VIVMVAIWLPVLALFTSFAVDFGHFFDYSRNLQNRADAAALAAGNALGGACFGSYTTTQTDPIGKTAQLYSGPPLEDLANPYTVPGNLPYAYSTWPTYNNVPNLTKGTPPNFHLLLNSTQNWDAGGTNWSMGSDAAHKLNSTAICSSTDEDGNTGAMVDVRVTQSDLGLFFPLLGITPTISAHARVTLEGVGAENNIIPLAVRDPAEERCVEAKFFNASTGNQIGADVPLKKIGTDPNTGAVQWDNAATPASVAIPAGANVYEQIVTGYCESNPSTYDSTSGLLYINSWPTGAAPTSGQAPKTRAGGVTVTGPCPADKLSNQYFTDETCQVGVTAHVAFAPDVPYPAETVTATDTSGKGGGALTLTKLSTQVNGAQTVLPGGLLRVNSTAGFAATGSIDNNGPANGSGTVTTFAYSAITDATHFRLTLGGVFGNNNVITQTGDTTWTSPAGSFFTINAASGQHPISISAKQTRGTVPQGNGTQNCAQGQGCTTSFGVQQQAFGACDDGNSTLVCNNPPDDSGPIVLAQLRTASDTGDTWASGINQVYGRNAFAGGGNQSLIATVEIAGLSNAKPGDPPTILRFSENGVNTDHATGLIDCGQGQSKPGSISAIINGCPTVGSPDCPNNEFTSCAPLAINKRPDTNNTPCDPEGNQLSGTVVARTAANPMVPVDCTGTAAGNMPPVILGMSCRVLLAGCDDQGKPNGTVCAPNNWSPTLGAASVPAGDPRALTMVITAPADLAKNNSGQIIPIENFAVFYITGWTTQGNNGNPCASYATAPPGVAMDAEHLNNCPDGTVPANGNCSGTSKGMVWGFWIKYTDPNAIPIGTLCNVNAFGNCTPALTR
jgi:hypothetical protein